MAHRVEPMEIDNESDFDNKENSYQHSNVLPRTPCTEKGYEELDVSELNMKLRYSITPAASPMSKSMSHCLDNRYNTEHESLNNTVMNENENNLTRSLNSTLSKTDVSVKALPLQVLQSDLIDSNRNSSVHRSLDTTITNDITITVNNENDVDCQSIPSSSSSMAHTPEATTPTKEIPKSDGGSPIMRGLKSVLSMFRSSQSPIPPSETDNNLETVLSPVDVPLSDPKPQATASTPINQKDKERSLSRRSSPHKESIVFNEDLEKELQWNDDSTIVFSSEKIPIHKLFFQDKPSTFKSNDICQNKKAEINSSVEYMDVSYNDLSVRDRTINGTMNKSKVIDIVESDGEFVDCETTFTQEESQYKIDEEKSTNDLSITQDIQQEDSLVEKQGTVNPIMDATQDILNLIDSTQFAAEAIEPEKQINFSSTDIVNQLSALINASETENNLRISEGQSIDKMNLQNAILESFENLLTDHKHVISSSNTTTAQIGENVCTEKDKTLDIANIVPDILNSPIEPTIAECDRISSLVTNKATFHSAMHNEAKADVIPEINSKKEAISVSPVDIPLPEDDFDEKNYNDQFTELHGKTMPIIETFLNASMPALDKTISESTLGDLILHNEYSNCPPSLLSSDVSLRQSNDINLVNSLPHEAITDVPDPVLPQSIETPNIISSDNNSESVVVNKVVNDSSVADSSLSTDKFAGPLVTEEKMQISFINQSKEKLHEVSAMDVSIAYESSPNEPESIKTEHSLKPIEEIHEKNSFSVIDVLTSNVKHNIVSLPDEKLTSQGESLTSDIINNLKTTETESGSNQHSLSQLQMSSVQEKSNDFSNTNVIRNIVNTLNVDPAISDVNNQASNEQTPQVTNITDIKSNVVIKDDVISTELQKSIDLDITKISDKSDNTEKPEQLEEKVDEEIVLSESNSPFVSVSAEGDFNSEFKKDDFEEVDIVIYNAENKCPSSLSSPKIISKGYNFDFDDIENMDPFATKTKIRMSPPPPEFQNPSLHCLDKISNLNRRKSMPVKENVLKAKKKFNSTFDSSESAPSKLLESAIDDRHDNNLTIDVDINKQDSCEPHQIAYDVPAHQITLEGTVTEDINRNKDKAQPESNIIIFSQLPKTSTTMDAIKSEDTKQKETELEPPETDPKNSNTAEFNDIVSRPLKTSTMLDAVELATMNQNKDDANTADTSSSIELNDTECKPLKRLTIIEDVVMSSSCKSLQKSDNTSSSEQSTYYSAGTSSTECESKNVHEIDDKDFNPFATKSKIRQTPPPDLDMVNPFSTISKIKSSPETSLVISHKDINATITIDNDNEIKEYSCNFSDCSSASKSSDDKDVTVQEVHTEDEDTIEGPFLEAEDANECDQVSETIDNKRDIVNFEDKNHQVADDNTVAAEMFIDAEAFEFLMNQNKADEVAYSGKESLFLKFDPLFARRVTAEGVASALSELKRRQSTPQKTSREKELISFEKPVAGPSDPIVPEEVQNTAESHDDMNITMSKPMMVVPPAVNPVTTPKKYLTPNRTNRLSMTFTSPAMAVIDRLLSLSGSSPSAGHDATVTHVSQGHDEADQALTQLRELLAEKEINVYNLRCESKELKDRLFTLESQMRALEAESADRLKKINELNDNLAEKTKMNRSMAAVVEEYERTIASLISETEQDKKRYAEERNQLIKERDEQSTHLASMEVSFSDLHSKYEKSKQVIMGYKTNEDAYKNSLKEFEDNLAQMHTNYERLKHHATSKLNHANQELEKINKAHEAEVLKLNAMIKRKDLHITSLEESLAQKTKANEELTAICDELINKVG